MVVVEGSKRANEENICDVEAKKEKVEVVQKSEETEDKIKVEGESDQVKSEPSETPENIKVESETDSVKLEADSKLGPVLGHGQDKGLFTSEIFKVELGPIPKMIGYGDLKKFITKNLTMKAHKIKYVKQHRKVFICFANDEERDLARTQLDGLPLKKETLGRVYLKAYFSPFI
jgi:hypothetical protein